MTALRPRSHIVVSGASGLLGSALVPALERAGYRVTRLVRRAAGPGEISWDPGARRLDPAALNDADGVIHLSGEPVGVRWTRRRKARIRASRVETTALLSETLARLSAKPRVLVSASAVGIYGDRGDEPITEESPIGGSPDDFLVSVAREWEQAADPARRAGVRVVHPRLGVVLSPAGGALKKLLPPFRLGLGGPLGSGRQWMSWISIDDSVAALHHLLTNDQLSGAVNLTAPHPVTNRDFTRALSRVLSRPAVIPVPGLALRLALGEMAGATLLASARVIPNRLLRAGFRFEHSDVESALRYLLGSNRTANFPA